MTAALLVLSEDDYAGLSDLIDSQGGSPFTLTLRDGSFLSFGAHQVKSIRINGGEALEIEGAKFLTVSGALRIIPMPEDPEKTEQQKQQDLNPEAQ